MSSLAPKTPRFAAFQYRDFRLQWIGQGLSIVGSEMQARAVDWHVSGILGDKTITLPILRLNVLMYQFATVLGPLLMGVLIGAFTNPGYVYAVNAISFAVMLVALLMMRYRGQERAGRVGLSMNSMIEGLRFTYDTRLIWSTMLLDFVATFFSSARS